MAGLHTTACSPPSSADALLFTQLLPFLCQHRPTPLRSPLPKQDPLLLQQDPLVMQQDPLLLQQDSHTKQNDGENSEDMDSAPGNPQWRC